MRDDYSYFMGTGAKGVGGAVWEDGCAETF